LLYPTYLENEGEMGERERGRKFNNDYVNSTLRTYARSPGLATVDVTALQKLARTFDVMMEDLIEVVEE
jgi:hypothetical protein